MALETLVALAGDPFQVDDAMQVTVSFRAAATLALYNPSSVVAIELIDTDGETVLQTREGADIQNVGVGARRVVFNAVDTVGFYYVRTTFVPQLGDDETIDNHSIQVANLAAVAVAGVLSVDEIRGDFLGSFGADDLFDMLVEEDEDGVPQPILPDATIAAHIRQQAAYVERALEVHLKTTRFACRPELTIPGGTPLVHGEDYDEEVDPLDMQWPHSGGPAGILTLPHNPVWRITRARIIYGQTVLYTLPTRWFNLNRNHGVVRMIVDSGSYEFAQSAIAYSATFGWILGAAGMRGQKWPLVWALDYEGGLPSVPEDVKALIGWRAVSTLLPVAARRANRAAVQSQSTSKDGVSRSMSVADSQPGGRFSALLQADAIKEWCSKEKIDEMRRLVRGSAKVF